MEDKDEGEGDISGGGEEGRERKYHKLNVHPPEFYPEDLIIRSEDFPHIKAGR